MSVAILTPKCQTTIPKDIRQHLNLQPGDRIEFLIEEDGRVVIMPVTLDVADLAGALPRPAEPVSLEAIEKTIRQRGSGG